METRSVKTPFISPPVKPSETQKHEKGENIKLLDYESETGERNEPVTSNFSKIKKLIFFLFIIALLTLLGSVAMMLITFYQSFSTDVETNTLETTSPVSTINPQQTSTINPQQTSTSTINPQQTSTSTINSQQTSTSTINSQQTSTSTINSQQTSTSTELRPITTTMTTISNVPLEPIRFVPGKFNFSEAKAACSKLGMRLAQQHDMVQAYNQGYERCTYGWLIEREWGYVMQSPRMLCGGGKVGLILSWIKSIHERSNAYCAPKSGEDLPSTIFQAPLLNGRSVSWWLSANPLQMFNLKRLLYNHGNSELLMRGLRTVFLCCHIFRVKETQSGNSTYVAQGTPTHDINDLISTYKKEFGNPDLIVYVETAGTFHTMVELQAATTNRSETVRELAKKASALNIDGIVFDYEPFTNYSREHAEAYKPFLDELADSLKTYGMEAATVISDWGILKYYDIYSQSRCRIIGSMASTYHGYNVSRNLHNVDSMINAISIDRLQIGISTENFGEFPQIESSWNSTRLNGFIEGILGRGVKSVHIWSGEWREFKTVKDYFLDGLLKFLDN